MRVSLQALALAVLAVCVPILEPVAADDAHVKFVADVERAKGHLLSSRDLYALGERTRASLHSSHPIQELGNRLIGPIRKADSQLAARVRGLLREPSRAIDRKVPKQEYAALVTEVWRALDDAVLAVVPKDLQSSAAFQGRVIAALLDSAADEYEEAVKSGKIVQIVEYQDAFGFVHRAHAIYQTIAAASPKGVAAEFDALLRAFPGVRPPSRPLPPREVQSIVKKISIALSS
jgi:hypothetical protein